MRTSRSTRLARRRGKILVFTAILLPGVILGGLANSVDLGVVAVGRAQLSTAADAASLAGARKLYGEFRLKEGYDMSGPLSSMQSRSTAVATANRVLGDTLVVLGNSSNSATGDISAGYLDTDSNTSALDPGAAPDNFNSVQVIVHRDGDHGANVPSFFGLAWRPDGWPVRVSSTATAQLYDIAGVRKVRDGTLYQPKLLPITLDLVTYLGMIAPIDGVRSDRFSYDESTGAVTPGPDGVYESDLYPVRSTPGNWGTINVGVSPNSTNNLSNQIRNGITAAQMDTYPNSEIRLDYSLTPPSITFSGDPGISAGIKDDLIAIIGEPRILPIYDIKDKQGNNTTYRVIQFVGVRIVDVNFRGSPKFVIVQPCLVDDPSGIGRNKHFNWKNGGLVKLYLSR